MQKSINAFICAHTLLGGCMCDSFIAFGDWGMNTSDYRKSVDAMPLVDPSPNFSVLLGDNYYDYGVSSIDDSLWGLFERMQNFSPKFYAVLGNHDYGQSIDAQSEYMNINPKWIMPARYYYRLIPFGGSLICAIFLDSYLLDDSQINWLEGTLSSGACQSRGVYRLVFTHYPIYTVGLFFGDGRVARLNQAVKPLLESYRVHAYVCGHEHDMEVFISDGVHYITAGAFAESYSALEPRGTDQPLVYRSDRVSGMARFTHTSNETITYELVSNHEQAILHSNKIYLNRTVPKNTVNQKSSSPHRGNHLPHIVFAGIVFRWMME